MTLFLEHALTLGGYKASARPTRMVGSILDPDQDRRLCEKATLLIDDKRPCSNLIK